ncbi:HAD hydrolase-like protein [Devosia albogilva]|uniref:HAD hydrolase-like protein n=1 Tax=Devosia albogilva TaxID=429726 RepID=A0ABW5QMA1_9HYPH
MTSYKMVICDFDGTLADSAPWFMQTLNQLADRHGFRKVSDQEIEMLRGKSNREIIRYLGVRFWQMPAIAREMRKRSAEAANSIRLFDGVPELLNSLKANGLRTAIVSSNGEDTVRRVLGNTASLVDHYACGASLFGKAAKFRSVGRQLRLKPGAILAVGDEGRDVEAAHQAGFASAAVTWGYATEDALRQCSPTFVVNTVAELAALLHAPMTVPS